LHVIATELHESARIDRQLFGRCGRQGDPGTVEAIISLEDELIRVYLGNAVKARLAQAFENGPHAEGLRRQLFSLAQWRAERINAGIRRQLLHLEDQLSDVLAFTGRRE
jgi:preprotein translocase subunit SecA